MMVTFPKRDEPVKGPCMFCSRAPREGEVYGPGPGEWDFMNICPECWERTMVDPEEPGDPGEETTCDSSDT